ncbi:MAG: DNA translocase FtsK, partial [Enhydrobacter sp.]
MQRNLFSYIWRHSRREQIVILGLVVLAQIFYFLSLSVPKSIVNNGISGNAFKDAPTVQMLSITIPLPRFIGRDIHLFDGFTADQLTYLVIMSFVFLGAVIINGQFRKSINTQKGRMGERMLRRLRYELYDRILRFPSAHFRKVKQAELATMIKDEVEPLGGFIGDAFVQPMFLGGQALTAIIFILMQNWILSLVVIVLLAVQMMIVPRLRKPVLVLGRQRQLSARLLAGRIAETADGVNEIHIHGSSNYERADISERLGHIFRIRFELYNKKFVAKFWNNILSQATPFAIYLLGGYFAITGKMDVGAVVGVLLAYKDLPGPIKELIDWDQQRQDVQIKYEQVIDQFQPEGMMPPELQAMPDGPPPPLGHELVLAGVTVTEDGRVKQLDGVSLVVPTDAKIAVIGASSSGKDVLGQVLARLVLPNGGSIKIDGKDFLQLPEYLLGSRLGYIGQETYLFPQSVRDNLLFGLKHRPISPAKYEGDVATARELFWLEAARSGNPALDPNADYELPALDLLLPSEQLQLDEQEQEVRDRAKVLEKTFADFGFRVKVVEIETGPVISQYEIELEAGLRLAKIANLADDLAIALRVPSVRIVAPIPGKNSVGVEVPNTDRQMVRLREVIEETQSKSRAMKIPLYFGKDVAGNPMVFDMASLPHLLIAGRTGTGKSVCLNSIIVSMLMTRRPDEVRMLMIDPKMVELTPFKMLPHLMHPVVTDMKKAEAILGWAVEKMEERYAMLARVGVRHLAQYNLLGREELVRRMKPESEEEAQGIP